MWQINELKRRLQLIELYLFSKEVGNKSESWNPFRECLFKEILIWFYSKSLSMLVFRFIQLLHLNDFFTSDFFFSVSLTQERISIVISLNFETKTILWVLKKPEKSSKSRTQITCLITPFCKSAKKRNDTNVGISWFTQAHVIQHPISNRARLHTTLQKWNCVCFFFLAPPHIRYLHRTIHVCESFILSASNAI